MIRKPAPFFSTEAKANFILQKFFELVPLKDVLEDGLKIQDIYDSVIYPEYEAVLVENRNLGLRYNQKVLGKYSPKAEFSPTPIRFSTDMVNRVTQCDHGRGKR